MSRVPSKQTFKLSPENELEIREAFELFDVNG